MPTTYVCENKHTFLHAAKKIESLDDKSASIAVGIGSALSVGNMVETYVCPECHSIHYSEVVAPQPEKTYVAKLGTGPQTEIDDLVAQGYNVVSRYSGQYHLEKPKAIQPEAEWKADKEQIKMLKDVQPKKKEN